MGIPEFQEFMLPVLAIFKDKKEHNTRECIETAIKHFSLKNEDIKLLVPSGKQTLVENRVYWSLTYLKKSLLLKTVRRGVYCITNRGIQLLSSNPHKIDRKLLSQYKEYRIFTNQETEDKIIIKDNCLENDKVTPEENIDTIYNRINDQIADDLLEIILERDGYYFERLVMDVLVKMGYGNFREESKIMTPKSNDGGIDGIINQDRLGLDKIYVQAKRWENVIGRPELQKFVGALSERQSDKGIFITTSDFTKDAREYIEKVSQNIILINGERLAKLMIENNVGVQINYTYEIKKVDRDYFDMI